MANLNILYKENGLRGIIPYAFGESGSGYLFLCDKLKETPSFVIGTKSNGMPYYEVDKDHIYVNLYSTEEQAFVRCDVLAKDKYYTEPYQIEPAAVGNALWKRYRDLGITHLRLDDAVWISMKDMAPVANYEGVINNSTPLRNPKLNAAMYIYLQETEAERCSDAMIALFWEQLKQSSFYVPIRPTRKLEVGETLHDGNSDFHFLDFDDGARAVLAFTDEEFKNIYGVNYGLRWDEFQVVNLATWDDIHAYLLDNPGLAVQINATCGDLFISRESIAEYEAIALNQAALANNR